MSQLDTVTQRDTTATINDATMPTFSADGAAIPVSSCASETLFFPELTWKNRTFVFNHPLPVRVTREDGGWTFESDDYRLMAYGLQRSEAESDFCFMFAECWDEIASESDEKLTQGARNQKRALLELVKILR